MKTAPILLRLPFWLADRFNLDLLLQDSDASSWAVARSWRELFRLSGPEIRFCRTLLRRKKNLWLYRCNQKEYCGDFLVVDISPPNKRLRKVWAIDLKEGEKLERKSSLGMQMKQLTKALEVLVTMGVIGAGHELRTIRGSSNDVSAFLIAEIPHHQ